MIYVAINNVIYNKRLGAFNDPPTPMAEQFYNNVCSMLDITGQLLFVPPYYKYIRTKQWKDYCKYWDKLFEIGGNLIAEERNRLLSDEADVISKRKDSCRTEDMEFLPYVLSRGELTDEEIAGNITELMATGVDTVRYTILIYFAFCVIYRVIHISITGTKTRVDFYRLQKISFPNI